MDGDTLVIYIQTIKEQMRYDRTEFVVTPGQKVRIEFSNPDAMDHNMLMVEPGAHARVSAAALLMETRGDGIEKEWNPGGDDILWASGMLAHDEKQSIEFTAPLTTGTYEYLCTFPGHSLLMRGKMRVKNDLAGRSVVAANIDHMKDMEDIVVSNRSVVEYWEIASLEGELTKLSDARSYKRGREMFELATCLKCHTIDGAGETLGPDLTKISETYNAKELLEHILDPSLKVDEEYKTYVIETKDRKEYFGIIVSQDERVVRIAENPLQPDKAVTIKRHHIEVMDPIEISPMPTDLLITLQKDEIMDLLAYVMSGGNPTHKAFKG